ncbi:MAG: glycosyltransferase family 39 protein [Bacteroidetes bacterium]|nr:glycosyltransferase family 39 protein [Bacteroidota bacterium]
MLLLWNAVAAAAVALITCLVLLGRADPLRPSLGWSAAFGVVFLASFAWMWTFTLKLTARKQKRPGRRIVTIVAIHGPLTVLALAGSLAIYFSDTLNHQVANFLQPTAPLLVLLAVLATVVAQRAAMYRLDQRGLSVVDAIMASQGWAIPLTLLLLGLLQGASYLWVIGDDFTRYWKVADAIRSWSGYPAIVNLPIYVQIGEPHYLVDLPGYSLFLLPAFALAGHNTLGAELPNLLANAALPILLYVFYRRAGINRAIAFAGSCVLITQPFFRLYTLNAPVPDAVFLALLVATGIAFEAVLSNQQSAISNQSSPGAFQNPEPRTQNWWLRWLVFGFLAGASSLTRPEGVFFLGFMGLVLLPALRTRGPYIAAAACLALVLPFVGLMYSTFGFLWPNNAGTTIGLKNIGVNLYWLHRNTMRWYANPFGLSVLQLEALLALLTAGAVVGSVWLARRQWRLAILPLASALNLVVVLMVDQTVSGIHLWFDFFRHVSYALPFLLLPLLILFSRLTQNAPAAWPSRRSVRILGSYAVAFVLLAVSFYQLDLLSHPSGTYGSGSAQLLTSDVWVSMQDMVAHQYQLPQIPFARNQSGVLVVDPVFDRNYMAHHLDSVRRFFEPYSTIRVDKGSQYEVSSILVLLFGSLFALLGTGTRGRPRDATDTR